MNTFSCHSLVIYFIFPCNKILLDFYFLSVMFLFLFFLFHNLDLELGLPLFSSWLKIPINLFVFMLVIIWTNSHQAHFCYFVFVILVFENHVYINKRSVATLALGLQPRQGVARLRAKGKPGVMPHAPGSVKECERIDPHTPKGAPTLRVGVPMDSWIFRAQLQG